MTELKNILIVEDDEDIRTLTNLALSLVGFDTILAGSGVEALKILETQRPDVVLLDVVMRGMDGFQTFKEIENIQENLPVIFLTARVQNEEVNTYLALGAVGVIAKPFDVTKLGEIIRNIWNSSQLADIDNKRSPLYSAT